LMLVSSHLCLSTIGHRIFGFFSPWPFLPYSLFQAIFRCRACHGFGLPFSGKFFSKATSSEPPAVFARRSRAFFTSLNLLPLLASF
jgi:hypothetical protein